MFFAAAAAFLLAGTCSVSQAVDTRGVDSVHAKTVLSQEDFQVIDYFVADGVQELLNAEKFGDIARLRAMILSRKGTQKQYVQQFSQSARKHIGSGLQAAARLPDEKRRMVVTVNLLILIDGLGDLMLADLSVQMLRSQIAIVRYWAVHSLTNAAIIQKLNSADATTSQLAQVIAGKLKELVSGGKPETIRLIAQFAASAKIPEGAELLVQIADGRIRQYAAWKVDYELLDGTILRLLAEKIRSSSQSRGAVAQRFGQLYSCAIQRYVIGKDHLSDVQKQQLASVLVGTEEGSVVKLLGAPQTTIKRAVERDDYAAISTEHNRLLGTDTKAGVLPSKLGFTYVDSNGRTRNGPSALPPPPRPSPIK